MQAITGFVAKVTAEGTSDFVPPSERIAVFDNDGTLWSEQPLYYQVFFIRDRVKQLAPQHPEWTDREPYASLLKDDLKGMFSASEAEIAELFAITHTGLTTEEFNQIVKDWIADAKHPETGEPYTLRVYPPMRELLDYLRANGFKTYIVTGGGAEFVRAWAEEAYGIPPEQVIGTYGKLKYEIRDGKPAIVKLPELALVNDEAGKPAGIQTFIGRRPILAFGNSDGDYEMLEWTTSGPGPRLGLIVHHDDDGREVAYDRQSPIGKLSQALDDADAKGWVITSMKNDWKVVFPTGPQR